MNFNPKIVTDGLILCLDAADKKSYSGSGTTWYDRSGDNDNATLAGGVGFSSNNGGALTFDGVDDKTSTAMDAFDLYCFEVAIKYGTQAHATWVGIDIGSNSFNGITHGSWTGTMDDETIAWFGYASDNPSGSAGTYIKDTISEGWHILTFNWNGTGYDIWLDGTKRTTYARGGGSGASGLFEGVTEIYGAWNAGWTTAFMEGEIGFMRAYNNSLTDQQVLQNFNAMRGRFGV